MAREEQSPVAQYLLRSTPLWLDSLVGWAASIGGLGFFAVFVYFAFLFSRRSVPGLPALAILGVLAAIAALLLTAGYRLIRQRPGRNSSLFGPGVWFALCGMFLALGAFIGFAAFMAGRWDAHLGEALSACLLLALFAYGASSHFRRKTPRHP